MPSTPGASFSGPQRQDPRRPLSSNDLSGWLDAASKREPPRPRDRTTLRNYLQAKNRYKWAALQRGLRWAEKELEKLGMNPEDTRWII